MKSKITRVAPELYNLFLARKNAYNTTMMQEQRNLVKIMGELEKSLGLDLTSTQVVGGKVNLKTKSKVLFFK